jgi:two-component system LytT family sensor kinase
MQMSATLLNYRQKSLLTEWIYLAIIGIFIPLVIGLQIFSQFSFTLSLIFVSSMQIPSVILFYRWLLPYTFGRKKYLLFSALFPVFIVVYELNSRLGYFIAIALPFIPKGYRDNLASARPGIIGSRPFLQEIGYTCLTMLAATSLYVIKRLFENQHALYEVETAKLKLELTHLKSQVQPHFFFNTLNNLYSLSVQSSPKTSPMIADLSAIMRYVLYESEHEKVPLEKEINFINSYVQLERIRHDDADIIDFAVQGDTGLVMIEPLLFLPLIENTFKHALQKDLPGKYVKMALVVDEDELIFQTSNPKPLGVTHKTLLNEGGIGLKNVKKRLELLYPGRHKLEIDTDDDTFNVLLTIRLQK